MSKKLAYERYYWFHNRIKKGYFPNAKTLAENFEISQKQAQRDIEFIKDRLGAPLIYDNRRKGYLYENQAFELPPIWISDNEVVALSLATKLSAAIPDKLLKQSIQNLLNKIFKNFSSEKISLDNLTSKVSVKNIEYYKTNSFIFQKVVSSLFKRDVIAITYYSPHKKEQTERCILPIHLLCYMGRWFLIAYCYEKKDLRSFALARIKELEVLKNIKEIPVQIVDIENFINQNFGSIFSKDNHKEVCLKFSSNVADWIKEQIWHEAQEITENSDGSVCLKFKVADFRELKGEILKYGASVEVLYPEELKEKIKNEIDKMKKIYR